MSCCCVGVGVGAGVVSGLAEQEKGLSCVLLAQQGRGAALARRALNWTGLAWLFGSLRAKGSR